MKINELVLEAHNAAKEKGWWEKPKSQLECHMLMVSELAEATEEARKGTPPIYIDGKDGAVDYVKNSNVTPAGKPEGELIELADVIIRIADYCGHKEWNLEDAIRLKLEYNKTRAHRHGGKLY